MRSSFLDFEEYRSYTLWAVNMYSTITRIKIQDIVEISSNKGR